MGPGAPAGMKAISQSIRSGSYTRPRTVLGFFWGIAATTGATAVLAVWALNAADATRFVPWVLVFAGIVVVASFVTVLVAMFKDPTRLMLGEMTGREYTAYRALTMGDDMAGERIEQFVDPAFRQSSLPAALPAIDAAKTEEDPDG